MKTVKIGYTAARHDKLKRLGLVFKREGFIFINVKWVLSQQELIRLLNDESK